MLAQVLIAEADAFVRFSDGADAMTLIIRKLRRRTRRTRRDAREAHSLASCADAPAARGHGAAEDSSCTAGTVHT
jgi:hypothetical protein